MLVTVEEWDAWTNAHMRIQDMGRDCADMQAERDHAIATCEELRAKVAELEAVAHDLRWQRGAWRAACEELTAQRDKAIAQRVLGTPPVQRQPLSLAVDPNLDPRFGKGVR